MRQRTRESLSLVLLAVLLAFVGVAVQAGEAEGFAVQDLELISMRSRPDWSGDWSGPIEAATVVAWFHDHGFPALLTDLNADGVVDEQDTIEQADRFGKGAMKTAESNGVTSDAWLVYGLASYVASRYPDTFALKIYDPSFPTEYESVGPFASDAVPGIVLTLMAEPSVAAYESELLSEEGVIVGIHVTEPRNHYVTGRSFLVETSEQGNVPVDFAWSEEDQMKPGAQGQVLNTEAMQTDALYVYFRGEWKQVEFMIALSPVRKMEGTTGTAGCGPGAIARDVTTTVTECGEVRIEECVTRNGDVDTYTWTLTNVSVLSQSCGVVAFGVGNSANLPAVSQDGPADWAENALQTGGWNWTALPGSCGIMPGESEQFSVSVRGPTSDCPGKGFVAVLLPGAPLLSWCEVDTTAPGIFSLDSPGPAQLACPDLTVASGRSSCTCRLVYESCTCTLTVRATISNIGGATATHFYVAAYCDLGFMGVLTDKTLVASLAPGDSRTLTFEFKFWCPEVDQPEVEIIADSAMTVLECSEENNLKYLTASCGRPW